MLSMVPKADIASRTVICHAVTLGCNAKFILISGHWRTDCESSLTLEQVISEVHSCFCSPLKVFIQQINNTLHKDKLYVYVYKCSKHSKVPRNYKLEKYTKQLPFYLMLCVAYHFQVGDSVKRKKPVDTLSATFLILRGAGQILLMRTGGSTRCISTDLVCSAQA